MPKRHLFLVSAVMILVLVLASSLDADAQCAMCKASAESSLEEGSEKAAGMNKAILYLMAFPYALGLVFAGMWYKNYKDKKAEAKAEGLY